MPMQRLLLTQQLLQLFVCGARGMNTIAHPPSQLIPRSIGHSASSQEMPSTSDHVLRQAAQQVLHAARQHTSDMRGAADTIAAKQDERTTTALSQAASPLLSRDLEPQSAKSHCTEPLSGEYLVKTPSVFRGVSSDGKLTDPLPILPKEETLQFRFSFHMVLAYSDDVFVLAAWQLIQSAWFYLSSSDARRELNERNGGSAALDADGIFDPSHEAIIACMRTRSAAAVSALRKSTGKLSAKQQSDVAARAVATTCQLLFPDNMSDTEFRLRESVRQTAVALHPLAGRKKCVQQALPTPPASHLRRGDIRTRAQASPDLAASLLFVHVNVEHKPELLGSAAVYVPYEPNPAEPPLLGSLGKHEAVYLFTANRNCSAALLDRDRMRTCSESIRCR
eukprot:6192346-Pleurochrysis_carterae.AAC.1